MTENYSISISKVRVRTFLGTILFSGFIYLQGMYYIIPGYTEFFSKEKALSLYDIQYMWLPIISYILASLEIMLITMTVSGKVLKNSISNPFTTKKILGLVDHFVFGLVLGLAYGFFFGVLFGFYSFALEFVNLLGAFYIFGFVFSLVLSIIYVFVLVFGLLAEFPKAEVETTES